MLTALEIVDAEPQAAAVIRLTIPAEACRTEFRPAVEELLATLDEQGLAPAGPLFDFHLKWPSDEFDFEVGFPIRASIEAKGRVRAGGLPAAKIARTEYQGPYESLPEAWQAFTRAIDTALEGRGWQRAGQLWQVYLVGPETESDEQLFRTLLNVVIERVSEVQTSSNGSEPSTEPQRDEPARAPEPASNVANGASGASGARPDTEFPSPRSSPWATAWRRLKNLFG
jgi:effector-binding domain-containing protein